MEGGDGGQQLQLIAHGEMVFAAQLRREILQLGGAQALVPGVVLPVDPLAVGGVAGGELLHHGGIHAVVGVQGLLDVVHQRVAALLRQTHGDEPVTVHHTAGDEGPGAQKAEHVPGLLQLPLGQLILLAELGAVILPEPGQQLAVLFRNRTEKGVGMFPAEAVDVVALAAVMASGKGDQILGAVEVILPRPEIQYLHPGIAGSQKGRLRLRYHRQHRLDALFGAIALNGGKGSILVAVFTGDGVVELHLALDGVADDEAARLLRPGGVEIAAPHVLGAHGILAQTIAAPGVILS